MKLLHFNDFDLGVLKGDNVVDISSVVADIPHLSPQDRIKGLIENFEDYRGKIDAYVASNDGVPVSGVRIRSPLPKPGNIDCMAVNYMENGTREAPAPINAFFKSSNCVIGNGDIMVMSDIPAKIFEGEAELAMVIGKRATPTLSMARRATCRRPVIRFINPNPVKLLRRWVHIWSPKTRLRIRKTCICNCVTTARSTKISTPTTWPTSCQNVSPGSAPYTRSSPATYWRRVPTTAASTRLWMATKSNWKSNSSVA
jgi:hypothetical protein